MPKTSYAIALGSNRRHGRHGSPANVIRAAIHDLARRGLAIEAVSNTHLTPALGPSGRSFANAAALLATDLAPSELLTCLKEVEQAFGRRGGRRWGARVLDLDLILWSEGSWGEGDLIIPHPEMRQRRFVLDPLAELVPDWRDPISGATVRQLRARLSAPTPVDRIAAPS